MSNAAETLLARFYGVRKRLAHHYRKGATSEPPIKGVRDFEAMKAAQERRAIRQVRRICENGGIVDGSGEA